MGFFGGDNEPTRGEELAQQQIELNQAELEAKRENLYKTRLDIIKGQGAQSFTPDRSSGVSAKPAGAFGMMGNAFAAAAMQSKNIIDRMRK